MSTEANKKNDNKFFMELALKQAKKALGNTGQNPSVGCVIVKNNSVIGSGHTSLGGRPHAEINAIKSSSRNLKNSSIYLKMFVLLRFFYSNNRLIREGHGSIFLRWC